MVWIIVAGVAGIALALVLFDMAVAAALGDRPRWLAPTRHALGEAGEHVSAAWADFVDWLRLGR